MAYKIEKPLTTKEIARFIIEHNHNNDRKIKETESALYALEPWEILKKDTIVDNTEEYIKEQIKKENEKTAKLKLTKREIFLAIYKNLKIKPDEIKKMISDQESLIEFEYATEYYRGNPLIDSIGSSLGYSKEVLDYLFINKKFPESKPKIEEVDNDA